MLRLRPFIKRLFKTLAGIYLLLNLSVATIPRCESILNLLQHVMRQNSLASFALGHKDDKAENCHPSPASTQTQISHSRICECSLVTFVAVRLEPFDHHRYIEFKIQSITFLSFSPPIWNPMLVEGPEPPYPRRSAV